ncbi:uncharacterized protein LOC142790814 [Rhipicephalus microplus]|uniref:uncharacterized protein LOC142790814 n=1 Tax=Rhipicephalus microplus TaxID=6941 RepID=UPI003F6A8A5A
MSKKAVDELRAEIIDGFKDLKESLVELKELKQEMKDLGALREVIHAVLTENKELKVQNAKLARKLGELEKYQRSNNLEIKGVSLDEEPIAIIKKIGVLVAEEVQESDIDMCHKVPTAKHNEHNIIVRFVRRIKRNGFLAKARKKKNDTRMLGFDKNCPVFINEHLTRQGKQLLSAAKQKRNEVGWNYVRTTGGKVMARRNETSHGLHIFSIDDINKMVA